MSTGNDTNISQIVYDSLIGCLVLLELIFMKMFSDLKENDSKLFDKVNKLNEDFSELKGEHNVHKDRCSK